jgi:hypothetical protein
MRLEISSVPKAAAPICTELLVDTPAAIVTNKYMLAIPLIVFDSEPLVERPEKPPYDSETVTPVALALVARFDNATRTMNVKPPIYVPFPVVYVILVIDKAACALIATFKLNPVESPFNARLEIASVPVHVALIVTGSWFDALAPTVIKKSMEPVPPAEIVIEADAFADRLEYPPYASTAVILLAAVPPVFENPMRTTKVMPPTYVPLPVRHAIAELIAIADRVWIATFKLFEPELPFNARIEIASVPLQVERMSTELLAIGTVVTVIRKSIMPVPLAIIVIVFEAFADKLEYDAKFRLAVMLFAVVPPVFENATRITKVMPPT